MITIKTQRHQTSSFWADLSTRNDLNKSEGLNCPSFFCEILNSSCS